MRSLTPSRPEELDALRRQLEAEIRAEEEHREDQGDPWIHEEASAGDIAWLRHVGKLLGVIPGI